MLCGGTDRFSDRIANETLLIAEMSFAGPKILHKERQNPGNHVP